MKIKTTLIIVFALIIVVFTLQNTEIVTVKLWFWEVKTSRALLIIFCVAIGTLFGMLLPALRKRDDKQNETSERIVTGKEPGNDKEQ